MYSSTLSTRLPFTSLIFYKTCSYSYSLYWWKLNFIFNGLRYHLLILVLRLQIIKFLDQLIDVLQVLVDLVIAFSFSYPLRKLYVVMFIPYHLVVVWISFLGNSSVQLIENSLFVSVLIRKFLVSIMRWKSLIIHQL